MSSTFILIVSAIAIFFIAIVALKWIVFILLSPLLPTYYRFQSRDKRVNRQRHKEFNPEYEIQTAVMGGG